MSGRGKNFSAEEISVTTTNGRKKNISREPGTFSELKKAEADEAEETMVQDQAGVKASRSDFGHNKDFGLDLMVYMLLSQGLRWQRICLQSRRPRFSLWVGKIPWRRTWQPIPAFWPGESHVQRHLVGYSPWGCKELGMSE